MAHEGLAGFLGTTGAQLEDLRRAPSDSAFLAGVLDYVMSDDALVVRYALDRGEAGADRGSASGDAAANR